MESTVGSVVVRFGDVPEARLDEDDMVLHLFNVECHCEASASQGLFGYWNHTV